MLVAAGLLASVLPLQAQNIIRPKIAGPNGLWVNSYNGVLFFGQTDLETQNTQMPMLLRFYYNSSASTTNYGYGLGFSMGYEMRYHINEIDAIVIETGDGRTDSYNKFGKDYVAPAGVFSKVTEYEYNKFVLTEKTGEKYYFDDPKYGKVTSIVDRYGSKTTFTYQDSLLVKIEDAVGHTINLSYTDGMMTKATASFHKGAITYEYDGLHRLKKRTDAMGNVTLYGYDKQNHINEITNANGHKTLIAYNNGGMVSRMKTDVSDKSIRYDGDKTVFIDYTTPQNQYSYYRWDDKGRVIEKVGLCCGIQSQLEYDDNDNVVKRTDANGNITTYTYDDRGNMLSLTDALGNSEHYTYEPDFNQVASFQDKNGNSYRFSYDEKGNMTSLDGPLGFNNRFTYNEKGWPLTTTDANGNVTMTNYNIDGSKASVINAAGYKTVYAYDPCGNILTITDAKNNLTSYSYNDNNQITSQTDALGNTTFVSYDKLGNIVRVKNAKNLIRAYSYDAIGNILTMTDPMGGVYYSKFDGKGNVLSVKDPLGIEITQKWNEKNKLLSQTNGEGETTSYDYDAKGNLTTIFLPNGNTINYYYDQLDRIEEINDNIGIIAKYTYDNNGNQLTMSDGLGRTVTYVYDALNRKISETLPSGSTTIYEYDGNNNLVTVKDAKGSVTTYTYDALNRQLSHTDALNAKSLFEYDENGNLSKVIDAKGNTTLYTYNAVNSNTNIVFANGQSLLYSYDELGNIIASKDRAGNEFKYTYDHLGNLTSKVYPNGACDTYTYDRISRMLTAMNNDATVIFSYDKSGRLLSETLNGKKTEYKYDVAGSKRTLTYPSGMKVEKNLNARDLITSIFQDNKEIVTMTYNVAGQKIHQSFANGITTEYDYNQNGWLSSIVDDHNIIGYKMTYDSVGNMTQREDLFNSEQTESYGYDLISQITSFRRGNSVEKTYEFDPLGNRVRTIENGVTTTYTSNNVNAYTNVTGGLNFVPNYDDNGNMLNDQEHTFVFDYNNKINSVDNKIFYKYDAIGRKIEKKSEKGTVRYYYSAQQEIERSVDDYTISYIKGDIIDETLLINFDNNNFYCHNDLLETNQAFTNSQGQLVNKNIFGIYGEIEKSLDFDDGQTLLNGLFFAGRDYDNDIGLYYVRARMLNPLLGRFIQKDPLIYISGLNDFAYTNNNPVNFVDPSGFNRVTKTKCDDKPNGPYISAPPYDGPYISSAPPKEPKKSFCEEHPLICDPSGNLQGEHCNVIGVGICFSGDANLSKRGGEANGNVDMAYGLYFSGSATAGVGFGNGNTIDKNGTDEYRLDLFLAGFSFSKNRINGDWEFNSNFGFGDFGNINASASSKNGEVKSSINGAAGVGGGLGFAVIKHRALNEFGK